MAKERTELQALAQARAIEAAGISFYRAAADRTQDPSGREMFLALARDEEDHLRLVESQWQALASGQGWLALLDIKVEPINREKPLFPGGREGLERAIRRDTPEQEALWFGLDIEIRSYQFYTRAAGETSDPRGQQMFYYLSQAEQKHFAILMLRYEGVAGPSGWQG